MFNILKKHIKYFKTKRPDLMNIEKMKYLNMSALNNK